MSLRFALIGAAGFVAPRHMAAIKHVDGDLVAALDVHDSVGILDRHFPDCRFFTSPERFDRYLNKQSGQIDYVSICSPNWLHDAHCRWALRSGANAICEKPLVLAPHNVDQLAELEYQTGRTIHPVLQLRLHPALQTLREDLGDEPTMANLTYVTRRGRWYAESWKGDPTKSGGILMNLGIHFFDMACWIFGDVLDAMLVTDCPDLASGIIEFQRGKLLWSLSTRSNLLPNHVVERGGHAYRALTFDTPLGYRREVDFSTGFDDLHNAVYDAVIAGQGATLADARPSIELVHRLRS
jgi:UDP-N-acetyl-2-amino-2-deoxyglucuronate dehydrogenase